MFGPSEIQTTNYGNTHHRSVNFQNLLRVTTKLFRQKFEIPDTFEILFVTGSGTLAIENVLASWGGSFATDPDDDGEFINRLRRLCTFWASVGYRHHQKILNCFCSYETAESRPTNNRSAAPGQTKFYDMVSAFPFYPIPDNASVWVTVTGKALGVAPGLSVIVVKKVLRNLFKQTALAGSELSLRDRINFAQCNETPHTSAIQLFAQLRSRLMEFDLKEHRLEILTRRKNIIDAVSDFPMSIMGEGPVITFPCGMLSERFAGKWGLYRGKRGYQVFLWSGRDEDHGDFVRDLSKGNY